MMWRTVLYSLLLIGGLFALTACYPGDRPPPYVGPVSTKGGVGPGRANLRYELTSSTNCGFIGNPIKLTLVITNANTVAYSESLPISVFDIQIEGHADQLWRWSDTVSSTAQMKHVSLAPNQSITLAWLWTIDPALGLERFPPQLYVKPIIRYRDSNGRVTEMEGGGYVRIPLGRDPAIGICPDIKP